MIAIPKLTKPEAIKLWDDIVCGGKFPGSRGQYHSNPWDVECAHNAGIIPASLLQHDTYYYGHCRNAEVALWCGIRRLFVHRRTKWGNTFNETIRTLEYDDGYDIFFPIAEASDYAGTGEADESKRDNNATDKDGQLVG